MREPISSSVYQLRNTSIFIYFIELDITFNNILNKNTVKKGYFLSEFVQTLFGICLSFVVEHSESEISIKNY